MTDEPSQTPEESPKTERSALAARCLGVVLIVAGGLSLMGWGMGSDLLKGLGGGGRVNPVSGVLFAVVGAALLVLVVRAQGIVPIVAARVCGIGIAFVGLLRVAAYITPWDSGIDRLLFSERIARVSELVNSRMAPDTAAEFVLVGVTVLLLTAPLRTWRALLPLPCLGVALQPALVLIGRLSGEPSEAGIGALTMGACPALLFLAVAAGLMLADVVRDRARRRAETGAGDSGKAWTGSYTERKVTVGFAAALIVMTYVGLASYKTVRQFHDDSALEQHARESLVAVAGITAAVTDSEAAARGYVVSGSTEYLERYLASASTVGPMFARLIELTSDNAEHRRRLATLGPLIGRTLQGLRRAIDLRRQGGADAALSLVVSDEGRAAVGGVLAELGAMGAVERGFAGARSKAAASAASVAAGVISIGGVLGVLLVALAGWLIHRDIASLGRAERELSEAKTIAEAASRAKSDFLAHMSHEIRTPLNGVLGMTDLLLGTTLNEQQRRYCLLSQTSARSLTTVINDILDFSKIEAGKLEVVAHEFNLHGTVGDVMDVLAQSASRKGLELACQIGPGVPALVNGDSDRLRQVLINLINNAIKFTERGGVVVRLSLDASEGDSATVRFRVTDTGVGVPEDRIDRLFKAFSQADVSTTRVYGGTGLGLAIVKQLATLLGGTVGVDSAPGSGSTFWFTAVFGNAEDSSAPRSRLREDIWAAVSERRDPRAVRVLVVADNPLQREVLREQVEGFGLVASAAADGEQALTMIAEAAEKDAAFHVAVVDGDLHTPDAVAFAKAARTCDGCARVALVLLLPVNLRADPAQLRRIGFAGHVTKPARHANLLSAILDSAAGAKGGAEPGETAEPMGAFFPDNSEGAPESPRILIAEDNEVNRIVASEILRKAGYRFESVPNGQEAVDAAKTLKYDLVLMDCQMPVMDGFEATREIRRWERESAGSRTRPSLPIVALTANALKGDRERCLEAGMNDYTSKPIDPKHLLATIASLLGKAEPLRKAA